MPSPQVSRRPLEYGAVEAARRTFPGFAKEPPQQLLGLACGRLPGLWAPDPRLGGPVAQGSQERVWRGSGGPIAGRSFGGLRPEGGAEAPRNRHRRCHSTTRPALFGGRYRVVRLKRCGSAQVPRTAASHLVGGVGVGRQPVCQVGLTGGVSVVGPVCVICRECCERTVSRFINRVLFSGTQNRESEVCVGGPGRPGVPRLDAG